MTTLGTNFGRLDAHSRDVAALLLVSVKSPLSRNRVPVRRGWSGELGS